MAECRVGLLGASSLVGQMLLSRLSQAGYKVTAFSRDARQGLGDTIEWRCLRTTVMEPNENIPLWICIAPIWTLLQYLALLEAYGARRIVVLSSTSRFTKGDSSDLVEQKLVHGLVEAEEQVQAWAKNCGVEWIILRPTLIYGFGRDKNIAEIVRFIRRFGFFPLFGKAMGLRQPIHADDVAAACLAALRTPGVLDHAYNLSGGETITYRDMVTRIFRAMGRRPKLLTVPLFAFRLAIAGLRLFPRYRHWTAAMAERMNRDMVFDHTDAARDLAFKPRPFLLAPEDISV